MMGVETTVLLRSELSKLRRPLLFWSCAAALSLSALFVVEFLIGARDNLRIARDQLAQLQGGPSPRVCEYLDDGSGTPCEVLLAQQIRLFKQEFAVRGRVYILRGAIANPLGAGGLASGFTASLPGAVAITLLASGHVAGEWNRGPARQRFSRDPRRWAFILGKFLSLYAAGVLVLVVTAVGLAILGPLLASLTDTPAPAPGFDTLAFTMEQVPRGLLVIAFFCALGTAVGILVRRAVGVVGVSGILFTLAVAAAVSPDGYRWSLATWVARLMRFTSTNMLADHVWIDEFPGSLSIGRAVLGLGFAAATCFLLAYVRLSREPFDE